MLGYYFETEPFPKCALDRPPAPEGPPGEAGPSKNELKKAAKKAEKEKLAAEKAAKAKAREEAQAAAEPVNFSSLDALNALI